jgi:Uncharacterized protein conserved in bacteria
MKKIVNFSYTKTFYVLVSLLFAIILFFTASASDLKNNSRNLDNLESNSISLEDIPIQLKYDSNKYFISGYDNVASVTLTSYNQVKLDGEANPDTRSFTLIADLTKNIKEGTSDIPVRIQGLSSGVTGQVDPSTIAVTVEKKASKTFNIKSKIDEKLLPDGYRISSITMDKDKVNVVSGVDSINKIDHVEAVLPSDVILDSDYKNKVNLQAVDAEGKIVSATIKPDYVNMEVDVKYPEKEVPLAGEITGTIDSKFSGFTYDLSNQTVIISGPKKYLDTVDQVTIPIDVTGVTKDKTLSISTSVDNLTVSPKKVDVKVKPVKK